MGSVSNTGVTSLLQILSDSGSPVLSSPALVSDLQNASPADIIQLSISAIQLQGMDTLLGISPSDASDGLQAAENQALLGTGSSGSSDPLLDVTA
jgi:hypothetical protein